MVCKYTSVRLDHCHEHVGVGMDRNLESCVCRTVPCAGGTGEQDCCTGLELHVVALVHSQWPKGDCGCTGQCVNYLLALSWALFEPKWTGVSTVTVTNGYASLTTATLNDPHSSSKSQHTHTFPAPPLPIETMLSVSTLPDCVSIKHGKWERKGEVTGESFVFHVKKRKDIGISSLSLFFVSLFPYYFCPHS